MFRRLLEGGGICGAIFRAAGLYAFNTLKGTDYTVTSNDSGVAF